MLNIHGLQAGKAGRPHVIHQKNLIGAVTTSISEPGRKKCADLDRKLRDDLYK
jgi:hypothetical protein